MNENKALLNFLVIYGMPIKTSNHYRAFEYNNKVLAFDTTHVDKIQIVVGIKDNHYPKVFETTNIPLMIVVDYIPNLSSLEIQTHVKVTKSNITKV